MWRYLLLGMPLLGLALFFVLSFELAIFLYLTVVVLAFFLYYKIQRRREVTQFFPEDKTRGVGVYKQ